MGIGEHAGALPAGTRVAEFVIEKVVGHPGHFGITYVAHDAQQRKIALKEYFPVELALRDGEALKLRRAEDSGIFRWGLRGFLDESEQLSHFSHSSVVKGHRAFEHNGTGYFAMEFIDGESFADLLQREGRMGESRLRSFLMPVVDGVRHAHELGLLHRDICPSDIRIAADGRPVLTDFAGARNVLRFKSKSTAHAFTPGYAPPEEYVVTGKQGAWTDVYSLAAVAYRAVTGQTPPDAPARQKGAAMAPAAELAAGRYPEDFLYAIDWGLRLDPAQRPQKVADWQAALDGELPVPVFEAGAASTLPPAEASAPVVLPTPGRIAREARAAAPAEASPEALAAIALPAGDAPVSTAAPAAASKGFPLWAVAAGVGAVIMAGAWFALGGGKPDSAAGETPSLAAAANAAAAASQAAAPVAPADAGAAPVAETVVASAGTAAPEEELSGLDRIALQLMQQEQQAKVQEAADAEKRAAEEAERLKKEQAAREQAAREQAAVQKKLEEEQNEQRRRQLEQEQARLKAEEEARLKAEAARQAAPAAASTVASAQPASLRSAVPQKSPSECRIHVSQLTDSGKLTYEDAKRARGAVIDPATGVIRLPPVPVAGGRHAVFEILPDGCARIARR